MATTQRSSAWSNEREDASIDPAVIGYAGLFGVAFMAATLLPAQSELLLAAMIAASRQDVARLLIVATTGNVLGSTVNWAIGRFLASKRDARWFPVPARALARAERWYSRWGLWTLLLSWVPVVGDPLTLAAGLLRAPIVAFIAVVTIAKAARYVFIAVAVLGFAAR